MKWKVSQISNRVHLLDIDLDRTSGSSHWIFACADVHIDSTLCQQNMLRRHLDLAVERNAPVIIVGDLFDSMSSANDKRQPRKIRPELDKADYLDALVDYAVEFFEPYKDNIALVTAGNHETAMIKHHNTNLTSRFATRIGCEHGGYRGWLRVRFRDNRNSDRRRAYTIEKRIHYDHGSMGGAVTKGVIGTQRRAVYLPDADVVLTGHIHESWQMEVRRERLSRVGAVYFDTQHHIQLPTYKEEGLDMYGWAQQKGMPPKPLGGCFLNFKFGRDRTRDSLDLVTERAT